VIGAVYPSLPPPAEGPRRDSDSIYRVFHAGDPKRRPSIALVTVVFVRLLPDVAARSTEALAPAVTPIRDERRVGERDEPGGGAGTLIWKVG
jgi:hypothetical protein